MGRGCRDREGQDAADAWMEGDKMPQTPGRGWDKECQYVKTRKSRHRRRTTRYPVDAVQENTEYRRSDEIHCGGGARSGPRGVRKNYATSPDGY